MLIKELAKMTIWYKIRLLFDQISHLEILLFPI